MVSAPFPNACPADVVRPIIEFHGTDDPIVPYGGGPVHAAGFSGIDSPGVLDTAAKWADHNGCTGATNAADRPRRGADGLDGMRSRRRRRAADDPGRRPHVARARSTSRSSA